MKKSSSNGKPRDLFDRLVELANDGLGEDEIARKIREERGQKQAVVVMDSTGFSRTVRRRGIAYYLTIVARMRSIVHEVFQKHGCLSQRAHADNVFAEFSIPVTAFEASLEAQKAVADAALVLYDDEPYGVCAGIGYGEMLLSNQEGPFGDEMNIASKLGEDTAQRGEILVTQAAYDALPPHLQSHFTRQHLDVSGMSDVYFKYAR